MMCCFLLRDFTLKNKCFPNSCIECCCITPLKAKFRGNSALQNEKGGTFYFLYTTTVLSICGRKLPVCQSSVVYTFWMTPSRIQNFSPTYILFIFFSRNHYKFFLQTSRPQSVSLKAYLYCSLAQIQVYLFLFFCPKSKHFSACVV